MSDIDTIRAALDYANKYRTIGPDRQFRVALAALSRVQATAEQTEKALAEIALAEGPFDRDALTHAGNVIEAMADIARAALASPDPKIEGL